MNNNNTTTQMSLLITTLVPSVAEQAALAVYRQFADQCDAPERRTVVNHTLAYGFFTLYALGLPLQLCILPANVRLARHRSAFLLLLYINILDFFWLLQYIWLCLEFLILGHRWAVPWNLEAYLFRIVNFCIDAIYIELAANRALAVLDDTGQLYQRLFNQKNNKVYLVVIFSLAICYSVYTNWLPERRVFHCLNELSYFEPTTSIPTNLLAQLPDTTVYDAIQHIYVFCIFMPTAMYTAAIIKLLYRFLKRRFVTSLATVAPQQQFNAQTPPYTVATPTTFNQLTSTAAGGTMSAVHLPANLPKAQSQFANFALERSRLFLLCFCSQLPYLLANGFHLFRSADINADSMQVMAIFWQFFGTIFHIQQPVLMLLLSRDMRSGVREDFRRLWIRVQECWR